MIQDAVSSAIRRYPAHTGAFLRTVIKESLQDFILNFIYTSKQYKTLIFTGGTCLRKIHNLPRLSEDIDFDFVDTFDITRFAVEIEQYFKKNCSYQHVTTKVSKNQRTVFIKFPTLLGEIDLPAKTVESNMVFVRCDFSPDTVGLTNTETKAITTELFTFFTRCYDLPTLFSNKINAFLERVFFKGNTQEVSFKGRDVFDLVWFLQQSEKIRFALQPNWQRVFATTKLKSKQDVIAAIEKKMKSIKSVDVARDLEAFIQEPQTLRSFSEHFQEIIAGQLKNWSMMVK